MSVAHVTADESLSSALVHFRSALRNTEGT